MSNARTIADLAAVTATATELNALDGITSNVTELNTLDGITADVTELNLLDGVTATTAEINYVDGVTSNVQTQIDSKVGSTHTGDVDITGELLVDSYNETFKKVSSVASVSSYDIANASYDSKSFSVSSQETGPYAVAISNDGTKMFVVGNSNVTADINEYTLSTAYDVSTASFVDATVATNADRGTGLEFKPDGTKVYVTSNTNNRIYQYSLSTAYDASSLSYDNKSLDTSSQTTSPRNFVFKSDGTELYLASETATIYQYTLSTAWDISTATYTTSFVGSSPSTDNNTMDIVLNADGTKALMLGATFDKIKEYSLSTAYDISTASATGVEFSVASQELNPYGLAATSTGNKLYVIGTANGTIYQYTTSTSTLNDSTAYAMSLKVVQDSGASGYTVTWPASVDWPAATAPTLTATASAVDQFVFYTYDGGTIWYGFTAGQALG